MKKLYLFCLLIVLLQSSHFCYATHVRAGEITARHVSGFQYEFTFTLYRDTQGVPQESVILHFGDGTSQEITERTTRILGNLTEELRFTCLHTFAAPGLYTVSTIIQNRNGSILNLASPSYHISFYTESVFVINSASQGNHFPVLQIPPVDLARVGQRFVHNAGAYDEDGDSLAYRLTVPKQGFDTTAVGYVDPTSIGIGRSESGGDATFTIDQHGYLVWDAPYRAGEYNVAFIIEEWRDGVLLSSTVRDMAIIVRDNPNKRPQFVTDTNTDVRFVLAGTLIQDTIQAIDTDGNNIRLTSFSELYRENITRNRATFAAPVTAGAAQGVFTWQTSPEDLRNAPYSVYFKAEDLPADTIRKLTDVTRLGVKLLAEPPQELELPEDSNGRIAAELKKVPLRWSAYRAANADKIWIYRKTGEDTITKNLTSIEQLSGYQKIGEVAATETSFTDDNGGKTWLGDQTYSYRIVAQVGSKGGSSFASNAVSVRISCSQTPVVADFDIEISGQQANFINKSQNAASFTWHFGDGAAISKEENPVHAYQAFENYQVLLVATDGCTVDSVSKSVNLLVNGLEDAAQPNNLQVYPNPVFGNRVYVKATKNIRTITVNNLAGKTLQTEQLASPTDNVYYDVSRLTTGFYLLHITDNEGNVWTKRLFVQ